MAQETLPTLLQHIHDGKIQIPEFQRKPVLNDAWIKSLLASVSLNYPIGAVMLLLTGNAEVRFESHPVAGSSPSSTDAERFLVDGQQRMTALYQVLMSGQAATTDDADPAQRWYYLDIDAALDPSIDRDETVVSRAQPGDTELELHRRLFPLRLVFGAISERRQWLDGLARQGDPKLPERLEAEILRVFDEYLVPTIVLSAETTRWTVRVRGGPEGPRLSDRFRVAGRS